MQKGDDLEHFAQVTSLIAWFDLEQFWIGSQVIWNEILIKHL